MNYYIPNWSPINIDWAQAVPHIENDDAISQMRLLQTTHRPYGAVILKYMPQLKTQLNDWLLSPTRIFSVFDYIQDTQFMSVQTLDYQDFAWPEYSFFDMNNFRQVVYYQGVKYATLYFDIHDHILWVDYFGPDGAITKRLTIDSRGFISKKTIYADGQPSLDIYLDSNGSWRMKHDLVSGQVTLNKFWQSRFDKLSYENLAELIDEVIKKQLLSTLDNQDHFVVSLSNDNHVPFNWLENRLTVYSASKLHQFDKIVADLPNGSTVVADSKFTKAAVDSINNELQTYVIPLMRAQFKLGHSQRLMEQQIAIFTENLTANELDTIMDQLYPRLLANPDKFSLHLFCYSNAQEEMGNNAIQRLAKIHEGEYLLEGETPDNAENDLDELSDQPKLPILMIDNTRMTSISQVSKFLDMIRLIIDLGSKPDELVEMLGISIGIPQLQRVETDEVINNQNGLIFNDLHQTNQKAGYYLDSLKSWNQALANDVQIMNRYSSDKLIQSWQMVWQEMEQA